ncbi:hypothetical protein MTO96_041437 [Rhipicephalus appendiculatus]
MLSCAPCDASEKPDVTLVAMHRNSPMSRLGSTRVSLRSEPCWKRRVVLRTGLAVQRPVEGDPVGVGDAAAQRGALALAHPHVGRLRAEVEAVLAQDAAEDAPGQHGQQQRQAPGGCDEQKIFEISP